MADEVAEQGSEQAPEVTPDMGLDKAADMLHNAMEADKAAEEARTKPAPQVKAEPTETEDSSEQTFTASGDIDLNNLPAEARAFVEAREKEMQADYTRKTQQIAGQRKQFEETFGDISEDEAKEALEVYRGLTSDQDYAVDMAAYLVTEMAQAGMEDELQSMFEAAGLTPAQAAQEAQTQVAAAEGQPTPPAEVEVPSFEEDPDAALKAMLENQANEITALREEMQAERTAATQEREESMFIDNLNKLEIAIRQDNPNYSDQDIESIYQLSALNDFDLNAAQAQYETIRGRAVKEYLDDKVADQPSASSGATPLPGGSTPTHEPVTAEGMSMDEAHQRAKAIWLSQLEADEHE